MMQLPQAKPMSVKTLNCSKQNGKTRCEKETWDTVGIGQWTQAWTTNKAHVFSITQLFKKGFWSLPKVICKSLEPKNPQKIIAIQHRVFFLFQHLGLPNIFRTKQNTHTHTHTHTQTWPEKVPAKMAGGVGGSIGPFLFRGGVGVLKDWQIANFLG